MKIKNKEEIKNILTNVKNGKTTVDGAFDRLVGLQKEVKRQSSLGALGRNISNVSYGLLASGDILLALRFKKYEEAVAFAKYNVGKERLWYNSYIICKIIEYRASKDVSTRRREGK